MRIIFVVLGFFLLLTSAWAQKTQQVLSGIIQESSSGEVAIGVQVFLTRDSLLSAKPLFSARTNKFGFYSIPNIPPGAYFLVVQGIGYATFYQKITIADANARVNIALASQHIRSQQITVETNRDGNAARAISTVELNTEFAKKMPVLGGESDIFRILQLMPGIKSGSEISSGLYIRGGSPDQNLILLDGVTVYNPSHLGGFLSTFNSDAIRDVRVIKGAFPAEYGGRLAGVVDLTMKEGTKEKITATGNISLIASRLTIEGPVTQDITFMASGRRTYFDLLLALLPIGAGSDIQYSFYDVNAKLNWKASENDRIFLSGYFGNDVASSRSQGNAGLLDINWGNATANLRWMHIASPSLFTNFSAIFTDYRFAVGIPDTTKGFFSSSRIQDFTLRGDAQYILSQDHAIKVGFEATYHNFTTVVSAKNKELNRFATQLSIDSNAAIPALEAGVYAQSEWRDALNIAGFTLNAGLRLSYFQRGARLFPEPRISAVYEISNAIFGNDIKLKTAFAVANQFLHLVVRNDITLPTDTWFPSTDNILPANSAQYVFGAETTLFENGVLLSIEGYYKSMTNLLEFRDNAQFNGIINTREQDLTRGEGESFGVEFFLDKRVGAFTGWLGYTLSWTTRTFTELNQGRPFFPRYDSRHDISLTLNYKLDEAWELGASWVFQSGQAFTTPSGLYVNNVQSLSQLGLGPAAPTLQTSQTLDRRLLFTERNGSRLPAYHRLDLNFSHYFTWFDKPFTLSLNVFNAYSHLNPFLWYIQANPSAGNLELKQLTLFPIVPSVGIGFKL